MFTNVMLAWAIPVDPITLCAQVEAYASTKGSLTALRCCIKHASSGTSVGQIPLEVTEFIAEYVRHNAFQEHQKKWKQDLDCWHGICRPSIHIDSSEYMRLKCDYVKSFEVWSSYCYGFGMTNGNYRKPEFNEERFEDRLRDKSVGEIHHKKTVEKFDAALNHEDGTRFTKALKVMKKDFGLEVHFTAFTGCMHSFKDGDQVHHKDLLAYLVLPSKDVYGTLDTHSFHSPMVVDSSVRNELSEEQKIAFKRAEKVLSLTPHTEDVQLAYMFPPTAYRFSKRKGRGGLKAPTKRALRMAFQEKEADNDGEWIEYSMSNAN